MKKSPDQQEFEKLLRSSKFSSCGFLGQDPREIWEIIEQDGADVAQTGKTLSEIANRMEKLTTAGSKGLGDWVQIDHLLRVMVDDSRGMIPCPWPHRARFPKRTTTVNSLKTGLTLRWSDLNIHLIREHGFFEGRGSPFRIEPRTLVETIFPAA